MRKEEGITLIALVITIIVLLILAGVSITTLTGDNGLLTKTSVASFKTEIAQYKEELDLSVINDEAEHKGKRTDKFNETEYSKIKELIPSFNKKYENSLVIEEDKLVYKGKDKTLYKMALEIGLISEGELLDDEILEELQPFITEWTVGDNDTITLPISGTCDFTVNYGDGTESKVTSSTDEDRIHTYTSAGTYTMTIKGKCEEFNFNKINTSKDKITKIIQWGSVGKGLSRNYFSFKDCKSLKGEIPSPSKNSFKNVSYFDVLFMGCSSLEGPIPNNLFYNCPKVERIGHTYLTGCFYGCTSLTGNIPEDLFKNCENVKDFGSCFRECQNLTGSIPEKLFEKNIKVEELRYVFYNCSGLTGNIPENLFINNTKAKNLAHSVNGCKNLTGNIPSNLFKNCTEIGDLAGTFQYCEKLTGSIPENLFENCTKITSLGHLYNSGLFYGCKGLTGEIPKDLFKNCTKIKKFNCTFRECIGLTGNIPENLFKNCTEAVEMSYVFRDCIGLTGNIPEKLFEKCNNVTEFSGTFQNCTSITGSIPENLFKSCANITTLGHLYMKGIFYGCKGLSGSIPVGLFSNCNSIIKFDSAFRDCINLTGVAPDFWNRDNVTSNMYCFSNCKNLSNYSDIPSTWK